MLGIVLLVAALILFILAALNVPSSRVSLGWAGMACVASYWIFVAHAAGIH